MPVDYVAEAVLALAGRPGTTYHLTAGEGASSVGELIELGSDYLQQRPPSVIAPFLYRRAIHPLLVRRAADGRKRALQRTEVFFPYFSMRVRYDDTLARGALWRDGIDVPPLSAYFDRLMDFALTADWGRRPVPRHQIMPPARRAPRPRIARRGARQDHRRPALHSLARGG